MTQRSRALIVPPTEPSGAGAKLGGDCPSQSAQPSLGRRGVDTWGMVALRLLCKRGLNDRDRG